MQHGTVLVDDVFSGSALTEGYMFLKYALKSLASGFSSRAERATVNHVVEEMHHFSWHTHLLIQQESGYMQILEAGK